MAPWPPFVKVASDLRPCRIALEFNELFLRVAWRPSLFHHVPGDVLKAVDVDALSREVAAADSTRSQSTPALRTLANREAARQAHRFTVDLFAIAENAVVPRFFAPFPEPLAEAATSDPAWSALWRP